MPISIDNASLLAAYAPLAEPNRSAAMPHNRETPALLDRTEPAPTLNRLEGLRVNQDSQIRDALSSIASLQTAEAVNLEIRAGLVQISSFAEQARANPTNRTPDALNQTFASTLSTLNQTAPTLSNFTAETLGLEPNSIATPQVAEQTLQTLGSALQVIDQGRAQLSTEQQTLAETIGQSLSRLETLSANSPASLSQLNQSDYAQNLMQQTRILMQSDARLSLQAQGEQTQASVLQPLNL